MKRFQSIPCVLAASALLFAFSHSASATLLVGFNQFDATTASEAHDVAATGFSGVVTKGAQPSVNTGGSNDGFYGNSTITAGANNGYARILDSDLTFSLTNSSGSSIQLDKLFFDAAIQSGAGTVSVKYKIGAGPLVALSPASVTNNTASGDPGLSANYGDFALNLLGVPLLNVGQVISFVFNASPNARIDNVAISAIPEPASLLALGCVLGSGLMLRNRRIKPIQA
jgi:hypothetical protein